jgi:GT2 family glycosyltransferase
MFAEPSFFDPRRHSEALTRLASESLSCGDSSAAFRYADRRCRLSKPGAREYLLRSEASRRAGHTKFAAQDLARAFEADPTDRAVKTLVMLWGTDDLKRQTARAIVADGGTERDTLRRAMALLFGEGARTLCSLTLREGRIAGWIAWTRAASLALQIESAPAQTFEVLADPAHGLADANWSCAEIEVQVGNSEPTRLDFLLDGVAVDQFLSPPAPRKHAPPPAACRTESRRRAPDLVTVIVPVYEDDEATRACVEAVFAQTCRISTRLVVIDDASPNSRLRAWLDLQAQTGKVELIRNERNLGFAASVNRALSVCPDGDVLLLNADALPPPDVLDRFVEAAYAASDIGTLTPLSNNGELTSFPEPYVANPLGGPAEVARLDALARQANGLSVIDLPNGVGFCLYITRDCLEAVGPLPEIYARGYYEDVEFCLRAREKGFRNVCAAGIYVGHAGARSFGADKRRLVMRNLRTLERRFPGHELECAAFVHADPLEPARRAIEHLAPPQGPLALLVCSEGASGLLAREEAQRQVQTPGEPKPLICAYERGRDRVVLRGAGEGPFSLSFSLRSPQALAAWLALLDVVRIELFDPLNLPEKLLKITSRLQRPTELVGADFEWIFPAPPLVAGACAELSAAGPCAACAAAYAPGKAETSRAWRLKRRRALLASARAIRPLDRMSEVFAKRVFGDAFTMDAPAPMPAVVAAAPLAHAKETLAILAPEPAALADRLIVSLGRALLRRGAATSIVVLGECVDDLAAMACGNVFVAGKVRTEEYERLLRQYEVTALMSPYRTRFFGRIDRLSAISGLPKVYFDWTFGKMAPTPGDLALDPRLCDAKAAAELIDWLESRRGLEA